MCAYRSSWRKRTVTVRECLSRSAGVSRSRSESDEEKRYLDNILPLTCNDEIRKELVDKRHKVSSNLRLSDPPTAPNVDQDVLQYLGLHQFVHQCLPSSIGQDRERVVDFISFHRGKRDEYVTYVRQRRICINEAFRKALKLPSQIPLEAPQIDPCALKTTALELMRVYIMPNYGGGKPLPRVQKAMEYINNGLAHKIDWGMLIFKEAMREISAMIRMSTKVKWNCLYSGYWHMVLVSENLIQVMPADAAAHNLQIIGDNIVGNQTKAPTPQGDDSSSSSMGSETAVGFRSPLLELNVNEFDELFGQSLSDNGMSNNQTKDPSMQEVDGSGSATDAALEGSQCRLQQKVIFPQPEVPEHRVGQTNTMDIIDAHEASVEMDEEIAEQVELGNRRKALLAQADAGMEESRFVDWHYMPVTCGWIGVRAEMVLEMLFRAEESGGPWSWCW